MSKNEEYITRAEFEEFAEAVRGLICEGMGNVRKEIESVRSEMQEPKTASIYHCTEEGCTFATDDVGAWVQHMIDERVKKLEEETLKRLEEEKPKFAHTTVEEIVECPECFPAVEKAFLERGWKKPEPKPKRKSGFLL